MKIAVLAGGISTERDVSLTTGTQVLKALLELGHRAVLIDLFLGVELPENIDDIFDSAPADAVSVGTSAPDLSAVRAMRGDSPYGDIGKGVIETCLAADIVFMALHGDVGENGKLQGMFDVMGIKYTGTGALGSALAMHKGITKQMLADKVPFPSGKMFNVSEIESAIKSVSLPCIVKPCSGGSSIGITRADTEEELINALKEAFAYENEVLVEDFIVGRELTCAVLGDKALPPAEIIPKDGFYDYEHKYQSGLITEICPAELTPEQTREIQELSLKAFFELGLEVYARMDFILTEDGRFYCLEANTLPGMTPTSHMPQEAKAAGLSYPELCQKIIDLSLEKY